MTENKIALTSADSEKNQRSPHPVAWMIALVFGAVWLIGAAIQFLPTEPTVPPEFVTFDATGFAPNGGHAFIVPFESELLSDSDGGSPLRVFEDDVELTSDANHARIRAEGGGLFSHWGNSIYLSSTDGTDPRTNGRAYRAQLPSQTPVLAGNQWTGVLLLAVGCVALLLTAATGRLGKWGFATAFPVVAAIAITAPLGGDVEEQRNSKPALDPAAVEVEAGLESSTLPAVSAGSDDSTPIEPESDSLTPEECAAKSDGGEGPTTLDPLCGNAGGAQEEDRQIFP